MCLFGRTWHGPPIPHLGLLGSEGGDVGYCAFTMPSRPGLMAGSGSCTQKCEHFRNVVVDKLRGNEQACSLVWQEDTILFRRRLSADGAKPESNN